MSKYLSVYQLLIPKSMFVGIIPHESSNNFIFVLFCPETGSNIVAVACLSN